MSPASSFLLRLTASALLLLLLARWLDVGEVLDRLRRADPSWLAAALALCSLQLIASASRWRRAAEALGVPLSRRRALADYAVAGLANQLLPGGVAGDVARAARHAHSSGRTGTAVRAVLIERGSGQIALAVVTALLLFGTSTGRVVAGRLGAQASAMPGWAALGLVALLAMLALAVTRSRLRALWQDLVSDVRDALLAPKEAPIQLALSLVVITALVAMFASAGRMLGVDLTLLDLAVLAPLVLLSMLIPLSIGGWGVRESAAAAVFVLAGHSPETGVAVSIAYGLIALLGSLPLALVALLPDRSTSPIA